MNMYTHIRIGLDEGGREKERTAGRIRGVPLRSRAPKEKRHVKGKENKILEIHFKTHFDCFPVEKPPRGNDDRKSAV